MAWVLAHKDFARACMVDLDTFTQHPLDDLWRECDEAVLLYQVPHAASQTMTAAISRCYDAVESGGAPHSLTHFGGELVAGSKARLADFMALCQQYFDELQVRGITPKEGDEAVWCGAATAVCGQGSRCVPPTPIFSATGWAVVFTMYRRIISLTRYASCICPGQPRTAS